MLNRFRRWRLRRYFLRNPYVLSYVEDVTLMMREIVAELGGTIKTRKPLMWEIVRTFGDAAGHEIAEIEIPTKGE